MQKTLSTLILMLSFVVGLQAQAGFDPGPDMCDPANNIYSGCPGHSHEQTCGDGSDESCNGADIHASCERQDSTGRTEGSGRCEFIRETATNQFNSGSTACECR